MMSKRMSGALIASVAVVLVATGVLTADAGKKKVTRGYLGVYMQEIDSDIKEGLDLKVDEGVLISGVVDDSPAEEAGLEDGDVVVMFAGKTVTSPDQLRDLVRATAPGTKVEVQIIRDGKKKTLEMEISDRPNDFWFSSNDWHPRDLQFARFMGGPRLGVTAAELNEELATYFKTKPKSGVLVLSVEDETVAAEAGLKAGDVIQKVGDDEVASVRDLHKSLRDFEEGDEFEIAVLRHGKKEKLKATMDDQSFMRVFPGRAEHWRGRGGPDPRVQIQGWDNELREEVNELRKELDELKKELKEKS